jgi:hypothetical protein
MLCLFFFAPFFEKEELYHPTFKRSAGGLLLLSQLESSFSICRLVRRVAPRRIRMLIRAIRQIWGQK